MRNRNIIYICFVLSLFFFLSINVNADTCSSDEIAFLKKKAETVTYQTDYIGEVDFDSDYQTYEIYFENLGDDFSVVNYDNNLIFKTDRSKERLESGNYNFFVYSNKCGERLKGLEINLLKFNEFSSSSFCDEYSSLNLDYCDEWYQGKISNSEVQKVIESSSSKEENWFDNLYEYYYVIFPAIVVVILSIIFFVRKKIKSSKLD